MKPQDDWKAQLEDRLMAKVRGVAKEANPKVLGADLDLHNGVIHVTTSEMLSRHDQKEIRERVLAGIREEFPTSELGQQLMRVNVRPPHPYPYTLHAVPVRTVVRPLAHPEHIREVSVKIGELRSLRQAYEELRSYGQGMDYVVTCARGGVPAMNYIAAGEFETIREVEADEKLAALQAKHHVFPGLNWETPTLEAKQALAKWLDSLAPGSSLLFFDTGKMGNGARTFFNFVVDVYLPGTEAAQLSEICILGVVDTASPEQRPEIREVENLSGAKVLVRIGYIHVDRVVTEDVQVLLGYKLLVHEELLQSIFAGTRVNLMDDDGKNLVILGTTTASSIFSSWLRGNPTPAPDSVTTVASQETQAAVADALFAAAYDYEKTEIQVAAACGLIDEEVARSLLTALGKKYRSLFKTSLRIIQADEA